MVVFLLLLITAILMFGAAAVTGAIQSLGKVALLFLALAVGMIFFGKLPAIAWLVLVLTVVVMVAAGAAWLLHLIATEESEIKAGMALGLTRQDAIVRMNQRKQFEAEQKALDRLKT